MDDVMSSNYEIRPLQVIDEARVQVRGQNVAVWPDALREPGSYRPSSRAYLEAAPPLGDSQCLEMSDSPRIEAGLEGRKS